MRTATYPGFMSTPRHRQEEWLDCPLTGERVRGVTCIRHCPRAVLVEDGAQWFSCGILDRAGGERR